MVGSHLALCIKRVVRYAGRTVQDPTPPLFLAKHYGFTDEELDFIINYDIKYRMGQDAGEID